MKRFRIFWKRSTYEFGFNRKNLSKVNLMNEIRGRGPQVISLGEPKSFKSQAVNCTSLLYSMKIKLVLYFQLFTQEKTRHNYFVATDYYDVTATYVYKLLLCLFFLLQSVDFFSRSSAFPKSDIVNNKCEALICVSEGDSRINSELHYRHGRQPQNQPSELLIYPLLWLSPTTTDHRYSLQQGIDRVLKPKYQGCESGNFSTASTPIASAFASTNKKQENDC